MASESSQSTWPKFQPNMIRLSDSNECSARIRTVSTCLGCLVQWGETGVCSNGDLLNDVHMKLFPYGTLRHTCT